MESFLSCTTIRSNRNMVAKATDLCCLGQPFLDKSSKTWSTIRNDKRCKKSRFGSLRGECAYTRCMTNEQETSFPGEYSSRSSAEEVRKEIIRCYELIQKLGKGVVYLGSSRVKPDHPHFQQAMELGREVSLLLDCTTWTGVGPGMMDAVTKGALSANKPVGGFKISREAGGWTSANTHPYLGDGIFYTCRFFSARKHGLADAAVRDYLCDRTAFVALPGGIGTLDEVFEILTLIQLERLGSAYTVPFLLMNYDGFYTKLLDFFEACKLWGSITEGEVEKLCFICNNNLEALQFLADFYNISEESQSFKERLQLSWPPLAAF